jgi:hypothetical protein
MKRWTLGLSLAVLAGLVLPTNASALNLAFNVKTNKEFVVNLFVTGSAQVLLDAGWVKANTDLDIFAICDELPAISFSGEPRFESVHFGVDDGGTGDGVFCEIAVVSFRGNSKGNLTVRITGTEVAVRQPVFAEAADGEMSPALRGLIEKSRAAKGRRARRQTDR